jgi:hypothetical protein
VKRQGRREEGKKGRKSWAFGAGMSTLRFRVVKSIEGNYAFQAFPFEI